MLNISRTYPKPAKSQACKINAVSRQHFYDIKKAYDEHGIEGLKEKSRRKPCIKKRVAPEVEEAVVNMAYEYPAYGQARAANELRRSGILVFSGGVRSIWQRHNLETFKKRLAALEEKSAKEGIVYIEAQIQALETAKRARESHPDEIETEHSGYLIEQDNCHTISLAIDYFLHSMGNRICQGCECNEHPKGLSLIDLVSHAISDSDGEGK